mgnify:CR=1 FL=1
MLNFFPPFFKSFKGYLGPIGDDIPSLIPIVVGLITFFAAFTFTLNEYNQRSQSFSADRDALIIANTLKGDSYLSNFPEFDTACNGLHVRGLNYMAGIVESTQWSRIAKDAQANQDNPRLSFVVDHLHALNGQPLICAKGFEAVPVTSTELSQIMENNSFVILTFPLALETALAVVPATLVVIAWKV